MALVNPEGEAEWRAHWQIVAASMLATTFPIVYLYATSAMIPQIEAEMGWTRAQISSGPAIVALAAVILAPLIGMAIDRYGPRRIGIPGAAFYLLSLAALSFTAPPIWSWWAMWALVAIGAAAASPAVWTTGVSSLFFSSRGLALAVTLTGTGLGSMLVPVTSQFLIAELGWRDAWVALAAIWALVLIPLLLFFSSAKDKARSSSGNHPAGATDALTGVTAREAILSARFAKLMLGACGIGLVCNGMAVNMVPILIDTGTPAAGAAALAGLVGAGSISGRLLGGILLDHIRGTYVGAASCAILVVSSTAFALYPEVDTVVIFSVFCVGLTIGIEYDAVAYLAARYFGMRAFGTVFGALSGATVLMSGVGPLLTNHIYDVFGSYIPAIWCFLPIAAISGVLFIKLGPYPTLLSQEYNEQTTP